MMVTDRVPGHILASLDSYEWPSNPKGRPPIILPPDIARRVIADVSAGRPLRSIARKYATSPYAFSPRWLDRAVKSGDLHRMAEPAATLVGR